MTGKLAAIAKDANAMLDRFLDMVLGPENADGAGGIGMAYIEKLADEYKTGNLTDEQVAHLLPDSSEHRQFFSELIRQNDA